MDVIIIFVIMATVIISVVVWNVKTEEWHDMNPDYEKGNWMPFWVRLHDYLAGLEG